MYTNLEIVRKYTKLLKEYNNGRLHKICNLEQFLIVKQKSARQNKQLISEVIQFAKNDY